MSAEAKGERMEELLDKVFNRETSCGALLKHCDKSTCVVVFWSGFFLG